ncbi:hypothetical protein [Actinophytocola gossypii]|uniref:DUF2269 domain-containing protein n=1 Tax=Actinophytocola gossypii TaxID=2812003 RepID=A0ABT2JD51_9PSEU|nr:hypothetical protein [Actinophytocola gossypii]MCT2585794.1 hypothetical protein [Actinophytocola gossypii]
MTRTETGIAMANKPVIKPLHGVPRKVWQLIHIVSAVGWLGIEVCVLGLATIGLTTDDPGTARTAHDAGMLLADTFFVPATALMFVSGLVLGLGTRWGLVKYYWVAAKLVIGIALLVAATFALKNAVVEVAGLSAAGELTDGDEISFVGMLSVIALLTLVAALLSVVKPWGRIPWRTRTPQTQES